jgi:hypothetical protein
MFNRTALSSRDGDCTIDSKAAVPSCLADPLTVFGQCQRSQRWLIGTKRRLLPHPLCQHA